MCIRDRWYTLCLSVSDKAAANSGKVSFYPVGFSLASYQQIMGDTQFFRSFLISAERTKMCIRDRFYGEEAEMKIESELGKGTEVTLHFPVLPA